MEWADGVEGQTSDADDRLPVSRWPLTSLSQPPVLWSCQPPQWQQVCVCVWVYTLTHAHAHAHAHKVPTRIWKQTHTHTNARSGKGRLGKSTCIPFWDLQVDCNRVPWETALIVSLACLRATVAKRLLHLSLSLSFPSLSPSSLGSGSANAIPVQRYLP